MTDEYLTGRGYKKYDPTEFDNESIVVRFQKCFKDNLGKKYFINVVKWSLEFIPKDMRDEWWQPYSYEYQVQITMFDTKKPLDLEFHSDWTLEEVEDYMCKLFDSMTVNYYERWDDCE